MNYHIEELNNNNAADWEKLNEESKEGSFFHTLKWKRILEQSFNYKSYYFILYRNDEAVALCPFYEYTINGVKGLVSLPTSDYNHIIIIDENDSLMAYHILDKCKEIVKKNKLFFILITTLSESIKDQFYRYKPLPYPIGGNMVLNLEEHNPNKIWNEMFTRKKRKRIKKFDIDGFIIKEIKSLADLKIFYKYYTINLESINVTPYTFSHFEDLFNTYSSSEMIVTLLYKNETIAGGVLTCMHDHNKTIIMRYLSVNRNLTNKYSPTYCLEWDMVKRASGMGYNKINFGRTPPYQNDIHYQIKKKFGCHYEKEISFIFPMTYLFKIGYIIYYNIYSNIKKYKYR